MGGPVLAAGRAPAAAALASGPSWASAQDLRSLDGLPPETGGGPLAAKLPGGGRGGKRRRKQQPGGEVQPGNTDAQEAADEEVASLEDGRQGAPPWFAIRDEPQRVGLRIHEELLDFSAFLRMSPDEIATRQQWVAHVDTAAKSLWPSCATTVIGSFVTGLCLPSGSVDMSIIGVSDGVRTSTLLKQLAERLLERGRLGRLELTVPPKVPKLRVQERITGLWAEVTLERREWLESTRFAAEQVQRFPALTPLVLLLKCFLIQRGLYDGDQGGTGSYALFCVVLHFLQRHPSSRDAQLYAVTSLGELLLGFFRYFGREHDYASVGLSVLRGGSTFVRSTRGWNDMTRLGEPTLCIESPTNPKLDCGASIYKIGVIRAAFARAYHVLAAQQKAPPPQTTSLVCPGLLRASHPMIARRYEHHLSGGQLHATDPAGSNDDEWAKRRRLDPVRAALAEAVARAISLSEGTEVQEPSTSVSGLALAVSSSHEVEILDPLENILDTLMAAGGDDLDGEDTEDEEEVLSLSGDAPGEPPAEAANEEEQGDEETDETDSSSESTEAFKPQGSDEETISCEEDLDDEEAMKVDADEDAMVAD